MIQIAQDNPPPKRAIIGFVLTIVVLLYLAGFGMTVLGLLLVWPTTKRSLKQMSEDSRAIGEWYQTRESTIANDPLPSEPKRSDAQGELAAERARRLSEKDLPQPGAYMGGGGTSMRPTIIRIAKANIANAGIALFGGALSTAASITSLFL